MLRKKVIEIKPSRAEIKILFVSPYPTDPEKKPLLKIFFFNFQPRMIFFEFHCKLSELSNVNSVILADCVFNFIAYSRTMQ